MMAARTLRFGLVLLGLGVACGHSSHTSTNFDNGGGADGGGDDAGGTPSFFDDDGGGIHGCPGGDSNSSVGCEYYAVHMDGSFDADNGCFVVFLANASSQQAHLDVSFDGTPIDVSTYAKIP